MNKLYAILITLVFLCTTSYASIDIYTGDIEQYFTYSWRTEGEIYANKHNILYKTITPSSNKDFVSEIVAGQKIALAILSLDEAESKCNGSYGTV